MAENIPNVLAVIPARGGSKRLPRKNIKILCGKPLIAYTIQAAQESKLLTDYLVSSEDEEILEIARNYNAPTPFIRPRELSGDTVRNVDVIIHAMNFMEEYKKIKYDIIILLQPTAPIRKSEHIDEAIEKLWNSDLDTLASVKGPFQKRDPILKRIDSNDNLIPYCLDNDIDPREPFYIYNASLYAVRRDYLIRKRKWVSEREAYLVMDQFHSTDVDDISDFLLAETYLKYLNLCEGDQ